MFDATTIVERSHVRGRSRGSRPLYGQERNSRKPVTSLPVIVTFILFSLVGLIWVIVDAPRLGYRRHDALFALIPIYGPYVFLPKMAWRISHKNHPYWQNWPPR